MRASVLSLAGFFSIPVTEAIDHSTAKTMSIVIIAICAGVILAALYNFYVRRVPGGVVRLLLSRGATSPENALSAEELGLLDKPFQLWELLRGASLRHIVSAVHPDKTEEAEQLELTEQAEQSKQEGEGCSDDEDTEQESNTPATAQDEPAIDAKTRFYIPEDKKIRAEMRFEQKGNGVKALVITCVFSVVLCIALFKLLPLVYTMISNFGK